MIGVELRHLRYFVAVAEEEHFGRAAERVGIAQPPLTQQIQKLEQLLGERLLERRPRVRLTAAGEAFLEGSRIVLAQVERTVLLTQRAAAGASGSLTVGFPASALLAIVPEAVRRYRERYPDVELKLVEMSTSSQISALSEGSLDLGFLRQAAAELAQLKCELSFSEPFAVVVPSGHPLHGRSSVTLSELSKELFVLFPQMVAPGLYRQLMALFQRAAFAPRIVQEAQEWLTIVGLVDAGVGVSIVPASFRRLRWGDVHYIQLAEPGLATTVSLFGPAQAQRPTARQFIEVTRAIIRDTREGHVLR